MRPRLLQENFSPKLPIIKPKLPKTMKSVEIQPGTLIERFQRIESFNNIHKQYSVSKLKEHHNRSLEPTPGFSNHVLARINRIEAIQTSKSKMEQRIEQVKHNKILQSSDVFSNLFKRKNPSVQPSKIVSLMPSPNQQSTSSIRPQFQESSQVANVSFVGKRVGSVPVMVRSVERNSAIYTPSSVIPTGFKKIPRKAKIASTMKTSPNKEEKDVVQELQDRARYDIYKAKIKKELEDVNYVSESDGSSFKSLEEEEDPSKPKENKFNEV